MNLKRAESYIIREQPKQNVPQGQAHSTISLGISRNTKQRVPAMMQSVLRSKISETKSNKEPPESNLKTSKLGSAIRSKIKATVTNSQANCEICEGEVKKPKNKNLQVYMCNCEHRGSFCESCLHHYSIYKIKSFEKVMCPHEGCPATMDMTGNFFKGLPADIQKSYKKIHQFYVTSQDPDLRLCPREECEGIIKKTMDNVMVCNECFKEFCPQCLLAVHEGECETKEVQFFQSNLHYRQCKKCKFVIEKNQGCNHMTCRCGNQFCYVCGDNWDPQHYGDHDENGRLREIPQNTALANYQHQECECCGCNCFSCCACECLDNNCCDFCSSIMKFVPKLFFFVLFLMLVAMVFVCKEMFVIATMAVVSIFAGLFGFSFELLSELEGLMFVMGVLLFPVTMILGIGIGFKQIFCDIVPELLREFCEMFTQGSRQILDA